jgi:hypothetical protein
MTAEKDKIIDLFPNRFLFLTEPQSSQRKTPDQAFLALRSLRLGEIHK